MRIAIYGAGQMGRIVHDILSRDDSDMIPVCFWDDEHRMGTLSGLEVICPPVEKSSVDGVVLAWGNDSREFVDAKRKSSVRFDLMFPSVVDRTSFVSEEAGIGRGFIAHPQSVVMTGSIIGDFCVLMTGATIDHDNTLEDFVNICPGVHTAGNVTIREGSTIGLGALILPGVEIGAYAYVGAGAVVTEDVPANTTVAGVPARRLQGGGGLS